MSLVSSNDIIKLLDLKRFGFLSKVISSLILKVTRLSDVNKHYNKNKDLSCEEFIDAYLSEYNITYRLPKKDLENIPESGAFVNVSNYPFGGIEGLILLKIFKEIRPDYKLIADFMIQRFEPLSDSVINVNSFDKNKRISNLGGLKESIFYLRKGMSFGVFPAKGVSDVRFGDRYIDKEWNDSIICLIQKAKVPVVPLYFHGKNSRLFYRLSRLHPLLQWAKLPSELFNKKNKVIEVRIGKPISVLKQNKFIDLLEYKAYLRKKTYQLSKTILEK